MKAEEEIKFKLFFDLSGIDEKDLLTKQEIKQAQRHQQPYIKKLLKFYKKAHELAVIIDEK